MRAGKARDHAAAIDVAGQHHRHIGGGGKSHIGDVAGAQIDLGGTARAFDDDRVIEPGERVQVIEIRGATALVMP